MAEIIERHKEDVPAGLGDTSLRRRDLHVAGGAGPIPRDGLGVEGDLEVVFLRQAHHDVAREPQVIARLHAGARAHRVGPFARDRVLRVCESKRMRDQVEKKDVRVANLNYKGGGIL